MQPGATLVLHMNELRQKFHRAIKLLIFTVVSPVNFAADAPPASSSAPAGGTSSPAMESLRRVVRHLRVDGARLPARSTPVTSEDQLRALSFLNVLQRPRHPALSSPIPHPRVPVGDDDDDVSVPALRDRLSNQQQQQQQQWGEETGPSPRPAEKAQASSRRPL